jgi:hypothetical protein
MIPITITKVLQLYLKILMKVLMETHAHYGSLFYMDAGLESGIGNLLHLENPADRTGI